jgi:hypothetical protein
VDKDNGIRGSQEGAHVQVTSKEAHPAAVQKLVYQSNVLEHLNAVYLFFMPHRLRGKNSYHLYFVFMGCLVYKTAHFISSFLICLNLLMLFIIYMIIAIKDYLLKQNNA